MTVSSTRTLSRFTYAAALAGTMGVLLLAPATAHAVDSDQTVGSAGCTYTDADGYHVPIDDGQDVFIDGKIVSCRGGTLVTTTAPKKNVGTNRPPVIGRTLPVFVQP